MLTRSILRLGFTLAFVYFFLTTLVVASSPLAMAQGSGGTQITGVVLDAQRHPVSEVQVRLSGAVSETTSTAGDGSFAFRNLPTGIFRLDISKAGFNASAQDNIVTAAGGTTNLSFTLEAASLTSLTIIGNVSVTARGSNTINTTPASIVDVPASTFIQQGQLQVNQILNEEPGITVGISGATNGDPGSQPQNGGITSIRGGLDYETESLIDGHMIALGTSGAFTPNFLSPYILQNVEIVKGPGATSPSINYAVNGTINYRTLEPTLKREESVDLQEDQYGGNLANLRATGTLPGGRLSYAFDYEAQGTQGVQRGFTIPTLFFPTGTPYFNGVQINPFGGYGGGGVQIPNESDIYNFFSISDSFVVCCPTFSQNFNQRNELGKIRYAFTPATTLTVTWLGGQTESTFASDLLFNCGAPTVFTPPAGYTGSFSAGRVPLVSISGFLQDAVNITDSNLFEVEFHTPLGKTATLQLREYSSSIQTFLGGPGNSGPTAAPPDGFTASVYGGVYASGASSPTIFNGQQVQITETNAYSESRSYNDLDGYTAEIDKQLGDDLLSLSYDEEKTSSYQTGCCPSFVSFPQGSSQTFGSVMGRLEFELGSRVNGTVSDNFGTYTDNYTQDGGLTFQSATHTYEAPRLSLTWRPNANQSVRASAGVSVAPPFIAFLNNSDSISRGEGSPPQYFTETGNTGDVLPETAFGFDLGFDTRVHSPYTVLSVDVYQTLLRNQFLTETTQNGAFTCDATTVITEPAACTGGFDLGVTAPLYITKTANLGHSEYEGIELSLHRTPPTGWGYRIQGSLMRAFAYDLPAGFYNTPAGPNTTNLGVLPNINFQESGVGFNGMAAASVPYSTGYGEINYRGRNGSYFLAGITYYGPNNAYYQPAFEVVTLSYNQPITKRTSLQLSIYNATNTYPSLYESAFTSPIYPTLVSKQVGFNFNNVLGPSIARLTLHIDM